MIDNTSLHPGPVFGPVVSRRLGISLGVNLLPADGKMCSFDCIYCECGLNAERRPRSPRLPTRAEVVSALSSRLEELCAAGTPPDVITFAGNGEPTLHPEFPDIICDTISVRDRLAPTAKVSVLSNASHAGVPAIRTALLKVDNNILKLDSVSPDYIARVNRPNCNYDVEETIRDLCSYGGRLIIQTIFMQGNGVDNTGDEYVFPWIETLKRIRPRSVMIYTIARPTPVPGLEKALPATLDAIAGRVRAAGIECTAFY